MVYTSSSPIGTTNCSVNNVECDNVRLRIVELVRTCTSEE